MLLRDEKLRVSSPSPPPHQTTTFTGTGGSDVMASHPQPKTRTFTWSTWRSSSSTPEMRTLYYRQWTRTVRRRIGRSPTVGDHAIFLSGCMEGRYAETMNQLSNTWTRAKKASTRLQVTWSFTDGRPSILFGDELFTPMKISHAGLPRELSGHGNHEVVSRPLPRKGIGLFGDGPGQLLFHLRREIYQQVHIVSIVVGFLGAWDPGNYAFQREVATKRYLAVLRKLRVCDCIRWGRDIYIQHLTGAQQYSTGASGHPNPPGTQERVSATAEQTDTQDSSASQPTNFATAAVENSADPCMPEPLPSTSASATSVVEASADVGNIVPSKSVSFANTDHESNVSLASTPSTSAGTTAVVSDIPCITV
ncbi:hypothetical protein TNCV_3686971 [Trichonephila clavipes]|nr:hypothetical protein TNCV_3686971 [Trichonephila clavipes]